MSGTRTIGCAVVLAQPMSEPDTQCSSIGMQQLLFNNLIGY